VRVLFERGRFGQPRPAATAEALAWYAVGLVAFAGSRIAAQAFYALGEAGTAVRWGVVSIAANVVAALALMWPFGFAGLAGASSVGALVNLLALIVIARIRLGRLGGRALLEQRFSHGARVLAPRRRVLARARAVAAEADLRARRRWLGATIAVGGTAFWAASVALGMSERTVLLRLYARRERGEVAEI
jgi:putative peptidoglycan lipid II flippase